MSLKRVTLAAAIAALPYAVQAQTALSTIVVTGSKEDAAARVDTPTLQSLRPATSDTASLLRDVPGVSLYGAGAVSSLPAIHGLADERLRLTVDGMDLYAACPNHMNTPLSYIDPTHVGAVKVRAGIAPVSAGGDFKNYSFTGRAGHTLGFDEVGSTAYKTRNHQLLAAFKSGAHLFDLKVDI
jgi:iron complex outermembrane receptor protein